MGTFTKVSNKRPAADAMDRQRLTPVKQEYLSQSLLCMGVGLAACGWIWVSGGSQLLALLTAAGGLALAVVVYRDGRRKVHRAALVDRAVEGLASLLGWAAPDRKSVRPGRRWAGEAGAQYPLRVDLEYSAHVNDSDPGWRSEVTATLGRRLHATYAVVRHDSHKCRIRFERIANPEEVTSPVLVERAQRTLTGLLGSSVALADPQWRTDEDSAEEVFAGFTARFDIETGVKLTADGYRLQVQRRTEAMLPGRWRAQWDQVEDQVSFQLRPNLPELVPHPPVVVTDENRYEIPYAIDEDGRVVSWRLRKMPHLLVTGKTGKGKTVAIMGIVSECSQREFPIWLADPKRIEFLGLRDWPNVQIVATSIEDIVTVIYHAHEEMERRYLMIEQGLVQSEADFEPLIVVLDELAVMVRALNAWWKRIKVKGAPTQCPVLDLFYTLASEARSADIHLITGMQRPDVALLGGGGGGDARDNFTARLSLGRLSRDGAMMMWEGQWMEATTVPSTIRGRGSAPAVDNPDIPAEVQTFWTPDPRRASSPEDRALLKMLRPNRSKHPKLQINLPPELATVPDSNGQLQIWAAIQASTLTEVDTSHDDTGPLSREELEAVGAQQKASAVDLLRAQEEERTSESVDSRFGPVQEIRAVKVQAGMLLAIESGQDWAEVEMVQVDVALDDYTYIDWASSAGGYESTSLPDDEMVQVRLPLNRDAGAES